MGQWTSHLITVQASDGSAATTNVFSISVHGPLAIDTNAAPNVVTEGLQSGTKVGITAAPFQSPGNRDRCCSTNSANGKFVIDAKTGVVSVAKNVEIDYETAGENGGAYTITVQVAVDGTIWLRDFTIDADPRGSSSS